MKTDIEILLESWKKYGDKKGRKAQRLKRKIESRIAFCKLQRERSTKKQV